MWNQQHQTMKLLEALASLDLMLSVIYTFSASLSTNIFRTLDFLSFATCFTKATHKYVDVYTNARKGMDEVDVILQSPTSWGSSWQRTAMLVDRPAGILETGI